MSKFPSNDEKFEFVRMLNLPFSEYAITSSGPLGVREIREIGDIDMVVSDDLWNKLAKHYGTVTEDDVTKIRIGEVVEILGEGSFYAPRTEGPTVSEQIAQAEVIGGLPFVNLHHILYFKQVMGRDKDQVDILAIKTILGTY